MGGKHCCYGICNSDSRYNHKEHMKGVFFFQFPKQPKKNVTAKHPKLAKKLLDKCKRWIHACGRPKYDFNIQRITIICV